MISVSVDSRGFKPDLRILGRSEKTVAAAEKVRIRRLTSRRLEIGVIFLSGPAMKRLNAERAGRNCLTDVLSFNFDEIRGRRYFLGEIYICPGRLKRQAQEYGQTVGAETALLFIHGFLHLLGYDHVKPGSGRKAMEKKQDDCLRAVLAVRPDRHRRVRHRRGRTRRGRKG